MKKFFVLITVVFIAHMAFAAESSNVLTGDLDLSRLDQQTNAGQYQIQITLDIKDQTEALIQRKVITTPTPRCLTEILVPAGSISMQMTDIKTGKSQQLTQVLQFKATDYSLDQSCPSTDFLTSDFVRYEADVHFVKNLTLPYPAPGGFQSLKAQFVAFPYGYSVRLKAQNSVGNHLVFPGLIQQLSAQLNRGNSDGLQYQIRAVKKTDSVSIGQGFINLK